MAMVLFSTREILLVNRALNLVLLQILIEYLTKTTTRGKNIAHHRKTNLRRLISIDGLGTSNHHNIYTIAHHRKTRNETRTGISRATTIDNNRIYLIYKTRHKATLSIANIMSIYYDSGSIELRIVLNVCVHTFIITRLCEGGKIIPDRVG